MEWFIETMSHTQVQQSRFKTSYHKIPPSTHAWYKQLKVTRSVLHKESTGHQRKSDENVERTDRISLRRPRKAMSYESDQKRAKQANRLTYPA
jgi:hypothetical protein